MSNLPMHIIHEAMTRQAIPFLVRTIRMNPIDGTGGLVTIFQEQSEPLDLSKAKTQVPQVAPVLVPQRDENGALTRDTQSPEQDPKVQCSVCGNFVAKDEFFKSGKHKKTFCRKL